MNLAPQIDSSSPLPDHRQASFIFIRDDRSGHAVRSLNFSHYLPPFRTQAARAADDGILVWGSAAWASPMFISLPEPCLSWGIRTIEERALTAAAFARSLLLALPACHRLFIPVRPDADLIPGQARDLLRRAIHGRNLARPCISGADW